MIKKIVAVTRTMAENSKSKFPEHAMRIKAVRITTTMNKTQFAKSFGTTRQSYTFWEKGESRIPIDHALSLCERYDLSLDYLYTGRMSLVPKDIAAQLEENLEALRADPLMILPVDEPDHVKLLGDNS